MSSLNKLRTDNTKTTAIVQARMGSTRLPGKTLKPLAGKPALWHVIDRLRHSKQLDEIVIATTLNTSDDVIEDFCDNINIKCLRGSEEDVLDRYYQAAKMLGSDPVVRITSDCPVIDPVVVDGLIKGYFEGEYEIYGLGVEFPDGLDCVMFSFRVLEDTWKNAKLLSEREHVGPYMEKHPEKYKTGIYRKFKGMAHHRWTLDEEADLQFLEAVYDELYKEGEIFLTQDILDLMKRRPRLMEINSGITRNEGYLKSLSEDEKYLEVEET